MSDLLQRLTDEIHRKEAEAAKIQSELAELSTALRVVQRMEGGGDQATESDTQETVPAEPVQDDRDGFGLGGFDRPAEQDMAGRRIIDACFTILREHEANGRPNVHYKEIAAEAKSRGYQGRSDKAMVHSFWAILNRNRDSFQPMGQGRFTLAERLKRGHS